MNYTTFENYRAWTIFSASLLVLLSYQAGAVQLDWAAETKIHYRDSEEQVIATGIHPNSGLGFQYSTMLS